MTISVATNTLLEKTAVDNGFDQVLPAQGEWLGFASTQTTLHLWLSAVGKSLFLAAVSRANVAKALNDHGTAFSNPLPKGSSGARGVVDLPSLYDLVRRAFQLSKALPDEPLILFQAKTAKMPKTTEAERLVVQRVGQDLFRDALLEYWQGKCAVTGLAVPELLRASHIKPWADCESDAERLDVFNGLLLAPHLDAAFDRGFITVADDGAIVVSEALSVDDRQILGLDAPLKISRLTEAHCQYLVWHRKKNVLISR
jgi:hypothetical protein